MGIVVKLQLNALDESTEAILRKGNGETVKRHATSIIPLLTAADRSEFDCLITELPVKPNLPKGRKLSDQTVSKRKGSKRKAAVKARKKNKKLFLDTEI